MLVTPLCPICEGYGGLGSTSYSAWIRNLIRCGSDFHSSAHVTFLSIAFSHRIRHRAASFLLSCNFSPPRPLLTSSWTRQRLSFPLKVSMWGVEKEPSPALPLATTPISLLWSNLASACRMVPSAFHFRPVLTSIPAFATFESLESLYCNTSLALITLNSSSKDLSGSCS